MPEQTRQLAAIMFTDIVGYTALMGDDEGKAIAVLRKNRQIQKPLIEKYQGRWLKELGDGVLASFFTVTDAVLCAIEIQNACKLVGDLKLRIGIHHGEVMFEENDVFGDGVNIASRLQVLAPVGGIWISESVYKNISNKKEIVTRFVKTEHLKNVKEPVRVYQVELEQADDKTKASSLASLARPFYRKKLRTLVPWAIGGVIIVFSIIYFIYNPSRTADVAKPQSKFQSIVVLYFNNMTGDPGQEYFCDGLTEEITDRLTKIKGLDVKSRHSALSFKDKPIDVRTIADKLGVDVLIEGSYRKSGNTGKVTVQLINGKTDDHYWSEDFVMDVTDIFKVQSDIALAIAKKLQADVSPETIAKINERGTDNIEAYDNFLKGSFFHYKKYFATRHYEDFEKSRMYFQMAIQLDSGYADAYAGLSDLYDTFDDTTGIHRIPNLFEVKEQLARTAFLLNPGSPMANRAMAWTLLRHRTPDRDSSLFYAKKAFDLDPANPINSSSVAFILSQYGLSSTAIPFCQAALKADPLDPGNYGILGHLYAMLGKYPEAKNALRKGLELTNERFDGEFRSFFWLIYFGEFELVEKRLKVRLANSEENRLSDYRFIEACLNASKGELSKIDPSYRHSVYVGLITNRNKFSMDILHSLELSVDSRQDDLIGNYDFLRTAYYFDVYRNNADFKRILAKAEKNYDVNLSKWEKFDAPN